MPISEYNSRYHNREQKEQKPITAEERCQSAGWLLRLIAEAQIKPDELTPESGTERPAGLLYKIRKELSEANSLFAKYVKTVESNPKFKAQDDYVRRFDMDEAMRRISSEIYSDSIVVRFGKTEKGRNQEDIIDVFKIQKLIVYIKEHQEDFKKFGIELPAIPPIAEEINKRKNLSSQKQIKLEELEPILVFYSQAKIAIIEYGTKLSQNLNILSALPNFLSSVGFLDIKTGGALPLPQLLTNEKIRWENLLKGYNSIDSLDTNVSQALQKTRK